MEMHVGVFFEPALVLFVGIEVVQDDVKLAARKGRTDAVHEAEKFDATPAPGMRGKDLSGGNLECGKQRRRAVALVIVALAGERPPVGEFQIALRPFQRLNGRLLIDAENNRPGRRFHIKADDVGSFLRKIRVVAFAPGFARRQIDLVVTQATPDILDVDIAQCPGQKRPCPAPEPRRWRLVQQLQYPFVRRRRVERLFARTWLILQPRKPMIGVAMPPTADNPRLNANLFGNRPRTPALRSQQNNPRALQVALHRPRRTATSFQLLAIAPSQSHFSCFGNHPDLESRLTIYEKRVLVKRPAIALIAVTRADPIVGMIHLHVKRRSRGYFQSPQISTKKTSSASFPLNFVTIGQASVRPRCPITIVVEPRDIPVLRLPI